MCSMSSIQDYASNICYSLTDKPTRKEINAAMDIQCAIMMIRCSNIRRFGALQKQLINAGDVGKNEYNVGHPTRNKDR